MARRRRVGRKRSAAKETRPRAKHQRTLSALEARRQSERLHQQRRRYEQYRFASARTTVGAVQFHEFPKRRGHDQGFRMVAKRQTIRRHPRIEYPRRRSDWQSGNRVAAASGQETLGRDTDKTEEDGFLGFYFNKSLKYPGPNRVHPLDPCPITDFQTPNGFARSGSVSNTHIIYLKNVILIFLSPSTPE